ncbi:MAG TPA: MerR family transcriptional regulator [Sphingobium sp.]|uniref:MerR family transcriptional regulator n=1 Tax=Sphingobium sp. TaxID=1912891 RepID=UPI002ED5E1D3
MEKADGAFLTIGELAQELGVAQHILRYWESRFPQLRPLQRAGNRRYYRPQDVEVARRIHRLLNVEGFTIKGAAKALGDKSADHVASQPDQLPAECLAPSGPPPVSVDRLLDRLQVIRGELVEALGESEPHSS